MTKGTSVAVKEERPIVEVVQEGANLDPEIWKPARIAAARALLPQGFQDPPSMIAFLARAQRSGLDPWLGELWAWKDGNRLIFMTGRDGWLSLARADDTIEYVEMGMVFDGDVFGAKKVDGAYVITHEVGIRESGKPLALMAYAVVHYTKGHSGELERRTFEDYTHLLSKSNWKQDPNGMLLTRCVSNAVKFATPKGAGLASSAHGSGEAPEASIMADALSGMAEEGTQSIRRRLDARKFGTPERVGVELVVDPPEAVTTGMDAVVVPGPPPQDVEDADPPLVGSGTSPSVSESAPSSSDEPAKDPELFLCQFCPETGPSARSIGAHGRKHGKEKEMAKELAGQGVEIRRDHTEMGPMFVAYDMMSGVQIELDTGIISEDEWMGVAMTLQKHWLKEVGNPTEPSTAEGTEDSTPDDGETASEPPVERKFQEIFELAQSKGLGDHEPKAIINGQRWAHVFADQKPEGAEEIQIWDLNAEGKESLYNIIDAI